MTRKISFSFNPKAWLLPLLSAVISSTLYAPAPALGSNDFVVSTFSGSGDVDGAIEVGEPATTSMAPDGTLFIADRHLFAVRKFKDGIFSDFVKSGRTWNGIRSAVPCGVFVKSLNEIYVSYCDLKSVDLFDSRGVIQRTYLVNVGISNMGFDWGGGLSVSDNGDIFLSEEENHVVIKIDGASGVSEIFAGKVGVRGSDNGTRQQSTFNVPRGLMHDRDGSLLIADTLNRSIRKIDRTGQVTTIVTMRCGSMGLDRDSSGFIYVVGDRECGGLIYKIGQGAIYDDSPKSINISLPGGIAGQPLFAVNSTISINRFGPSPSNEIFIADWANNNIKVFSIDGRLLKSFGESDSWGVTNSLNATKNQIYNFPHKVFPIEDGSYLVVDNSTVRHVSSSGEVLKVNQLREHCWYSMGVAIGPDGTLYCSAGKRIFVSFPDGQFMYIGSGQNFTRDGSASTSAFKQVEGMAFWRDELFVVDGAYSGFVRKVVKTGAREFQVTTVLGSGTNAQPTDTMSKASATLIYPNQIAFDFSGNLFIGGGSTYLWKTRIDDSSPVVRIPGDFGGSWIMGVATDRSGVAYISTELGSIFRADSSITRISPEGIGAKNGLISQASFYRPIASFIDAKGALLVADRDGNKIRKIQVGVASGYGNLTIKTASPYLSLGNSGNSGSSSNSSLSLRKPRSNNSWSRPSSLVPGLSEVHQRGYFRDDTQYFASAQTIKVLRTTSGALPIWTLSRELGEDISIWWGGYFIPDESGSWDFRLTSDDASYLWLGKDAVVNYSFGTSTALLSLPGVHPLESKSQSVYLEKDKIYPLRIQFGNAIDVASFKLEVKAPSHKGNWDTNLEGLIWSSDFTDTQDCTNYGISYTLSQSLGYGTFDVPGCRNNPGKSVSTSVGLKPSTPTFSGVNFSGNKVNIDVNLGSNSSNRPDRVYLVAPKLGIQASNPALGKISGSSASWTLDINKLLTGTAIPLEIVAERDGIASDPLLGTYQVPSITQDSSAKSVPAAPKNFKSRILGDSALITVDTPVKSDSLPTGIRLVSSSLGYSKAKALKGEIVGDKGFIEVPLKRSMFGKKYPVLVYFVNSKGESKALNSMLSIPSPVKVPTVPSVIPVAPKTPPKTVICVRANQTRAFEGENCPPGWEKR
jgi:hypothetical protein